MLASLLQGPYSAILVDKGVGANRNEDKKIFVIKGNMRTSKKPLKFKYTDEKKGEKDKEQKEEKPKNYKAQAKNAEQREIPGHFELPPGYENLYKQPSSIMSTIDYSVLNGWGDEDDDW
jgi:hypothetical protein